MMESDDRCCYIYIINIVVAQSLAYWVSTVFISSTNA